MHAMQKFKLPSDYDVIFEYNSPSRQLQAQWSMALYPS